MSVIEDALRRAEMQGRSTPPQSVAQPGNIATAAAVVTRPVLTPSTGESGHHKRTAPNGARPETVPAKPKFNILRESKPTAVIAPQRRYIGTLLIAAFASLVLGNQFLETLLKYPPLPAIIVAETDALSTKSATLDSLTDAIDATFLNDATDRTAINRPIPIDTSDAPAPALVSDRARITERSPIDPANKSTANAALIESINQRFHVAGVMVSAGKRLAVINDVVVGVGDRVDGAIVRAVDERGAVIEVDGMEHHLNVSARSRNDSKGHAATE